MPAPTPHIHPFRARLLCLMGMLLSCGLASAATVRAYIQPDHAQTGQIVTYVITVQNGTVQTLPQLRLPVQVIPQGAHSSSQNIEIRGNQQVISTQIAWGVASSEPGEFVIAPQEIQVNGEVLKTNEVRLVVTEAPAVPGAGQDDANTPLLQMEVGKTEFYQGEVVPITATLFMPRNAMLRRASLIEVNKTDFAIARFPMQADQTETVINGIGYIVYVYRSTLSALQPGELKVGPASSELLFDVIEEDPRMMRRSLPFGMMMRSSETRKFVVKSQEVKVKVLPLPEGKPANFSGAVGDFNLSVTATPLDLAVGDPLAVDVIVDGNGNFEGLPQPSLAPPDGWKPYPPRRYNVDGPMDANLPPTSQRRIGYSMVFVPEKVHAQLPPFELSYFSPTQKKYVTASTAPIPLRMKPGVAVAGTTDVASTAGAEAPKPPEVQQPKPDISDILANVPAKARWLGTTVTANVPLTNSSRFWIIQSIPAILVLLALLFSWFRNMQKEAANGLRGEVRKLWQGLEQRDLDDREFLQRAAHFIHRTQPEVRDEELRQILRRYETLSFTSAHAAAEPLQKSERDSILQRLAVLMRGVTVWTVLLTLGLVTTGAQAADEAPDEVYRQAREALEKGKFTQAQYLAESLTKRNPPALSAEVFAIIGNARYRQDDFGRAALWYQRAQLLDPANAEVRQNLRHLDEKLRFFQLGNHTPLTEWSLLLHKNTWIIAAAAGVWLMLLAIVWRILAGKRASASLMATLIGLGFLVFLPSATLAALRPEPELRVKDVMVVTAKDTSAFSSATVTSGSIIDLPPGSQIRLLEKRGAWSYIEIPSGNEPVRGWVEAGVYTPLWPWAVGLVP